MRRRSTHVLLIAVIIAGSVIAPPAATAQTTPISNGVAMTNVYDAFGSERKGVKQDFGFSTVVQYGGKTILFDAGTDARVFESNLKSLKIDLRKIDIAIVSHGHYDHIGGFDYLLSVNPKVKIYLPNDFTSLGAPIIFPFRGTDPVVGKPCPKTGNTFAANARSKG